MIYKQQNGGIIKLQKAGSLPKWMQKLNSWSIPDSDESAGERILNSTIEQANDATTQEERDQIYKDSAKKNLAVTGQSLMMIPMLNEFTTYGLLGGGLRLGAGVAGSKAGEYVLGKGGDWLDKQLHTKFLGTTGRIIGGLGGWWGGAKATTPLFRSAAGNGITLYMPQETFMNLRGQHFANVANKAVKSLDKSPIKHIPIYHGTNYLGDDLRWFAGGDAGLHAGTTPSPALAFIKRPGYVVREGFVEVNPKEIVEIHDDLGGWSRTTFDSQRGREVLPEKINEIIKNSDPLDYTRGTDKELRRFKELFDINPSTTQADPEGLGIVSNYKGNYTLANELSNNGIKIIKYPNEFEGDFGNMSLMITDPKRYVFAKHRLYEPIPTSPQEAATTYHFDGRMPLTRPISFEERLGWTRGERMQPDPKNPIPVSLINRSDSYLPIEGDNFVLQSPEISKRLASVHFTMNEPVTGHGGGSWDSASTTLIFPYGNIRKVVGPINIEPMDTFFPNYNGLRFKTKGAKVLTGDRTVHDYYTQHGVDSQFSEELEALLKEYKAKAGTAEKYLEEHDWIPDEGYFPLRDAETALSDRIQQIHYDFVDKYATRPSYEDLLKLEKIEGLRTGAEPVHYNSATTPLEDKLGYTWFSAPSTHSGLLFYDPGDNISSLPKPMQDFVKWLWEHKADYRKKKGGIIKGQDGIEELPVQKSSTNVAQKPIPRRALSPIEGDWEEANHDPNLYEYQPYDDPYVKEFFEQDVLPRYMRENPNASQEEIDAVRSAYTNKQIMSSNIKDGIGGRTDTDKFYFYGIPINSSRKVEYNTNYKLSRPVIVHENTHAYRQGLLGNIGEGKYTVPYKRVLPPFLGFGEGSGYTNKEVDYLQNGYDLSGFDFSDYGSEENQKFASLTESGTTNAEIRYRLWRELYDKLGKVPTLEETDEFIKNYDKSKLWSLINNANAYGQKAYHNMIWNAINSSQELPEDHTDQDEIDLRNETESQAGDRLKDALIHVADNNQKTDMTNLAKEGLKIRFTNKLHK